MFGAVVCVARDGDIGGVTPVCKTRATADPPAEEAVAGTFAAAAAHTPDPDDACTISPLFGDTGAEVFDAGDDDETAVKRPVAMGRETGWYCSSESFGHGGTFGVMRCPASAIARSADEALIKRRIAVPSKVGASRPPAAVGTRTSTGHTPRS